MCDGVGAGKHRVVDGKGKREGGILGEVHTHVFGSVAPVELMQHCTASKVGVDVRRVVRVAN